MKPRVRRKMKRNYTVKRTPLAKFLDTVYGKITLGFLGAAVLAGLVCLIVLVAVPAVKNLVSPPEKIPIKLNDFKDSLDTEQTAEGGQASVSYLQKEAAIEVTRINDPYICGREIVFSSADVIGGKVHYSKVFLYDTETQHTSEVTGIKMKYDNIISLQMNENYIVYLDSASGGGGTICAYNRRNGTVSEIKDYLYAAPQVSLDGSVIAFMQQAGDDLDRLYLYDLETGESNAYRVFSGLPTAPGGVCLRNGILVYEIPYTTDDGYQRSRVYTLDLATGEEHVNEPGKLTSYIRTNGRDIAFLSSVSGAETELYLLDGVTPVQIDTDVVNFDIQENYIVYTKDQNIYLYTLSDRQISRLNSDISRGMLANANGNMICWYDITEGFSASADIVRYAEVN